MFPDNVGMSYRFSCYLSNLFVFLSQNSESSAKKLNKTPVKQNGPAGKASGSAIKPQIKVGNAL